MEVIMAAYKAYGKDLVEGDVQPNPRAAALVFFTRYPLKRVCTIYAGEETRSGFRAVPVQSHYRYWRDVTRQTIDMLFPNTMMN